MKQVTFLVSYSAVDSILFWSSFTQDPRSDWLNIPGPIWLYGKHSCLCSFLPTSDYDLDCNSRLEELCCLADFWSRCACFLWGCLYLLQKAFSKVVVTSLGSWLVRATELINLSIRCNRVLLCPIWPSVIRIISKLPRQFSHYKKGAQTDILHTSVHNGHVSETHYRVDLDAPLPCCLWCHKVVNANRSFSTCEGIFSDLWSPDEMQLPK